MNAIDRQAVEASVPWRGHAKERLYIALILVFAFALRLYIVTGPEDWTPRTIDTAEGGYVMRGMKLSGNPGPDHDRVARHLLAGRGLVNDPGMRHTTRPPLYPLVIAGSYRLFGRHMLPIGLLHAVLGTITCFLVWKAAMIMSTGTVASIAAGITAVMPEFLKYTPRLYESTLVVFLIAALVLVLFVARKRESLWWPGLAGLILGLVALTRLELLVILPFVALWQILHQGASIKRRVASAAVTVALFAVLVSPWLMYNRTTSVDGLAHAGGGRLGLWLWERLGPQSRTVWEDTPTGPRGVERGLGAAAQRAALEQLRAELGTTDPDALDPYLKREAIDFMLRHPVRVISLMMSRLMMLWNLWPTPPPHLAVFLAYWAFLGIALMGAIIAWRQPETRLLLLITIAVTLFYSFIHGHPRYRLPAMIPVIMLASVQIVYLWNRLHRRRQADGASTRAAEPDVRLPSGGLLSHHNGAKRGHNMKLIVQIPCYNEEQTIAATIADIPRTIPGIDEVEVLIIDDGCADATVATACANGADHVVSFPGNKGLAAAFSAGLERAVELGADIIVNTDADNQYCGECIPDLIRPIIEGSAEMVVGCRPIADHPEFSWMKKRLQRLGSWVVRHVSHTSISDATSGFRAYSRTAAQRLTVVSPFTYTHETLIQAGRSNMAVAEVPIRVNRQTRPSRLFKSIPQYIAKSLTTILRIYSLYQPLTFFFLIGALFVIAALGIGGRFLYYYIQGSGTGHIQSLILGAVLGIVGVQIWVVGLLADLIAANRKLSQEILYQMRRNGKGSSVAPVTVERSRDTESPGTTSADGGGAMPNSTEVTCRPMVMTQSGDVSVGSKR